MGDAAVQLLGSSFSPAPKSPGDHNFVDCAGMGGASMQRDCRSSIEDGPRRATPAASDSARDEQSSARRRGPRSLPPQ